MDPNYKSPSSLDVAKLPSRKPSHDLEWPLMCQPLPGTPPVSYTYLTHSLYLDI